MGTRQAVSLVLLALAVPLAWWARGWVGSGAWLASSSATTVGVMAIFFVQGLLLPTREIWEGLGAWRVHAVIQAGIFLLAPALALVVVGVGLREAPEALRLGVLYLGVLPTTVASAVGLTDAAGGRVTVALVNTALSNLLGVVVVPLWVVAWWGETGGDVALAPVLGQLARLIVLPLFVGQVARGVAPGLAKLARPVGRWVNDGVIIYIIFLTFGRAFADGQLAALPVGAFVAGGVAALVLLIGLHGLVWVLTGRLGRADRVAAFFTASQKTLAAGVPMSAVIFAGSGLDLSLVLLPLLIYHPTQLVWGWLLVPALARWREKGEPRVAG